MIKLLKHYLFKRANSILITSIILMLIVYISQINANYILDPYPPYRPNPEPSDYPLGLFTWFSVILAAYIGIKEFCFKMSKISVDQMYSLPIKRHKLFIVKYVTGIIEIIIPLLLSFIVMYIVIATKEHLFNLSYMIPFFLSLIGTTIIYYTIVIFFFTRCNTTFDGLINVGLGTFSLFLIFDALYSLFKIKNFARSYYFIFFFLTIGTNDIFEILMKNYTLTEKIMSNFWQSFFIIIILTIAMTTYMLLTLKNEKSENTEYQSNSTLAYKLNIPIYVVSGITIFSNSSLLIIVLICIGGYLLFVIKNRKFKLSKTDLIILLSSIVLGIILGIFANNNIFINPNETNSITYF